MSNPSTYEIISLSENISAEDAFLRLAPLGKRVWLDSGIESHADSRFHIISAAPIELLKNPSIEELEAAYLRHFPSTLNQSLNKDDALKDIPFAGGILGYFNYEYAHKKFGLTNNENKSGNTLPSMFGVYDWAIVFDKENPFASLIFLKSCSEERKKAITDALAVNNPNISPNNRPSFSVSPLEADTTYEEYAQNIAIVKNHILDGDTYQINYAHRFSASFSGAADTAYCQLRETLPGPFSAYLELNNDTILSFSPERFISVQEGFAQTKPIKGTVARGTTVEEDKALAQQLMSSEKNRAENVMIVDLLRNDFSKSCQPNSVKVRKLCDLESFKNVHHLVSTIEGRLEKDRSILSFFVDCFPGGSITGAPKKRSMEIIDSLETHPRNIYCGSICYYSAHGKFDSNIAIRTLCVSQQEITCWGGGGIVIDSDTKEEYEESRQKVSSLINALNEKAR